MKRDERNVEELLRSALPSAPREEMETALNRVFARLQSDTSPRPSKVRAESTHAVTWWKPALRFAAAALVVAAVVWGAISLREQEIYAVLEASDGSLYRVTDGTRVPVHVGDRIRAQETVQSNGAAGAVLALADGSHVEMRSKSALAWDRATDGLTIRLDAGSIIVNAADQQTGHLYVQTKDVTVSVAGTIFLVNAEEDGSRVAVIQGEVSVREQKAKVETKLRPGQQVSTSPSLVTRPVKEEIAWSRHADAHFAILDAFMKGMAQTAGPLTYVKRDSGSGAAASDQNGAISPGRASPGQAAAPTQEFEEASIRQCDPDNLPPTPGGARGGGANSLQMTPGRTHALCLTLATLIRTAYQYGPADLDFLQLGGRGRGMNFNNVYGLGVEDGVRVRGGADWVRSERYTIDAVADGAVDAETMRGPMLKALLERRFNLKAHVETEQLPAWSLSIASSGLKIKPMEENGCDQIPVKPGVPSVVRPRTAADIRRGEKPNCGLFASRIGPNQVIVGGGITLAGIAQALGGAMGGKRVFDKTGNTDRFNFILEFAVDDNAPGNPLFAGGGPFDNPSADVPRAPTVFTVIDEQFGLKLEPARSPREFIVIDHVERPTPN